jgi:c-di-AMP phosphodiesterase-like protein
MEPYASSSCQLITELLQYQTEDVRLEPIEATALLAGIIVDTLSFTLRTGSRTFDAASYLRTSGADTALIQTFLKIDIESFVRKSKLIEKVYFYREGIAITKGSDEEVLDQTLIAQTADELLLMDKVSASFVISKRDPNTVSISARSLGKVNVQLVMEVLHGGGHLTNAATQLTNITVDEAEENLKAAIDHWFEGDM